MSQAKPAWINPRAVVHSFLYGNAFESCMGSYTVQRANFAVPAARVILHDTCSATSMGEGDNDEPTSVQLY